jgi:hypothetical protein
MSIVISKRVEAGPNDALPPGAAEAEFAYRMSRLIRYGLDEPIHLEQVLRIVEAKPAAPALAPLAAPALADRKVGLAVEAVNALLALRAIGEGITVSKVRAILGVTPAWVKHLRKRDCWAVMAPYGPRREAVYYLDSVIETARRRVDELIGQQKRRN